MEILNQTFEVVDLALQIADSFLVLLILAIHFAEFADGFEQFFAVDMAG